MQPTSHDDHALLARYAAQHHEDFFRQLVARHLDLVYSAALRQTRAAHLAEEAAQSVFIELSRSATRIRPDLPLTAWLYTVTRRKTIDLIRRESTRHTREQLAVSDPALTATSAQPASDDPAAWSRLTGTLDDAMLSLRETDRTALLLRFFANKPLRDIGAQLGISEDAAQKRLSRALDRLRENFTRRGFAIGTATLATALSAHAAAAAPLALASSISTAALLVPPVTLSGLAALLAMTTAQKTVIATTLALTLGCVLYEAHLLGNKNAELAALRSELADARTKQAAAEKELAESDATLALADDALSTLARQTSGPDATLRTELNSWLERVRRLKDWASRMPDKTIPEMSYLTDSDWLEATRKAQLNTEIGARQALNSLRSLAKNHFAQRLYTALRGYQGGNDNKFPASISELAPFFPSPVDPAILARYRMVETGSKRPSDLIVEIAPVDDDYDTLFNIQRNGGYGSRSVSRVNEQVKAATIAYQKARGAMPTDYAQIIPFFETPPSPALLEWLKQQQAQQPR